MSVRGLYGFFIPKVPFSSLFDCLLDPFIASYAERQGIYKKNGCKTLMKYKNGVLGDIFSI